MNIDDAKRNPDKAAIYIIKLMPLFALMTIFIWATDPFAIESCSDAAHAVLRVSMVTVYCGVLITLLGIISVSSSALSASQVIGVILISYVKIIFVAAILFSYFGIVGVESGANEISTNRWDYLYFSIVTLTTLGYGDFRPCASGRLVSSFHALVGFASYPLATAVVLRAMWNNDKSNRSRMASTRREWKIRKW